LKEEEAFENETVIVEKSQTKSQRVFLEEVLRKKCTQNVRPQGCISLANRRISLH
jgi:hypothetical protein